MTGKDESKVGRHQPLLVNEFGRAFYGLAETVTGHSWDYVDSNGVRRPLMPETYELTPNAPHEGPAALSAAGPLDAVVGRLTPGKD